MMGKLRQIGQTGRVIRDNLRRMQWEILKLFQSERGSSSVFSMPLLVFYMFEGYIRP